jgi:hypothetical protein
MVEECLREGRALRRIRARAELVEQHECPWPGRRDDPDDRPQVPREGRERLRDRLLVADVGEHVPPDREPAAGRRGHVQARLVHEAEQSERAQRDGLAAGVRTGHDERGIPVAEAHVDRDDATAEARMTGRQEDDLGPLGDLGAAAVHVGRERGLGGPQVEPRERAERLAQRVRVGRHERRQLVEDAGHLLALGDLRLSPGVPELDGHERLDEQGLTAPRGVVDDALDPGPCLGLDRDHVAAVAQRDDRLLERTAEFGTDQRVEPAAEPVVGDPDGRPKSAEAGRGRVQEFTDRVEASGERRARVGAQVAPEPRRTDGVVGERRGALRI